MSTSAKTVDEYLESLPEDRQVALSAVRKVILANLDDAGEEGMQYGMIGYYIPHRVFPDGYHCDPKQPLPYAALGSQKNHMSLHLGAVYGDSEHGTWFREAWTKTGKKLDMGAACIRFKRLDDLPLDVIAEAIRRVPPRKYLEIYRALRASYKPTKRATLKKTAAVKRVAKKAAKKR